MLSKPVLGTFAVVLYAVGHYAVGHFAVSTLRRKDSLPWDISPYDFSAVGYFAVFFAVRTFRRKYFFGSSLTFDSQSGLLTDCRHQLGSSDHNLFFCTNTVLTYALNLALSSREKFFLYDNFRETFFFRTKMSNRKNKDL